MFIVVYPPLDSFICSSSSSSPPSLSEYPGRRGNDGLLLQNKAIVDRFLMTKERKKKEQVNDKPSFDRSLLALNPQSRCCSTNERHIKMCQRTSTGKMN